MKIGIAVGTATSAEWIELTVAAIPGVNVAIIDSKAAVPAGGYKFLIVDGDDPGSHFLSFYKQAKQQSPGLWMLVLGSPSSPLMMTIDWEPELTCFLPKPYQLEVLRETFAQHLKKAVSLEELKPAPAAAATKTQSLGYLSTLRLADLLQMLCLNQWTGKISAQRLGTSENGEIFLSAGNIVHAHCTGFEKEESCYEMLAWGRCEFTFLEDTSPVIATIHTSWEAIVMEGARRLDERSAESKSA